MASSDSLCSGSPASKSTLDTPENEPYDNFFNLTTPSDLRLSHIDDSYAEWKALPSRLLESPPPQVSSIHLQPHRMSYGKHSNRSRARNRHDSFDVSETSATVDVTGDSFGPGTESPPPPAIGRHFLEKGFLGIEPVHSAHGSNDMFPVSNSPFPDWNPQTTERPTNSTRHLKISNITPTFSLGTLYELLQEFGDVQEYYTQKLLSEGFCVVSYLDIRDAIDSYIMLQIDHLFSVQFCSSGYVTMLVMGSSLTPRGMDHRLEVMCIITSGGYSSSIRRRLYHVLSDFGAISKFTALENTYPPTFLITFLDPRDAADIIDTVDGLYVEGFRLKMCLYDADTLTWNRVFNDLRTQMDDEGHMHNTDDTDILSPQPIRLADEALIRRDSRSSVDSGFSVGQESDCFTEPMYSGGYVTKSRSILAPVNPKQSLDPFRQSQSRCPTKLSQSRDNCSYLRPPNSHVAETSSQSILGSVSPGFPFQLFCGEMAPKANGERLHGAMQVPGKNVIDLERVSRGLDTRTTVMLRNIPNKVDQYTLKEYVDTTSRGLYNFLYLRIDFRNICNVGYAFINFIDPLDIIDFVKAKSGTRWNKFNSEKVLDVTYANIQGIDQLVEKFRNSSVMDQDPTYRPKLFYSSGPFAGTEMEFPPANNILKKCRSISAAQQIGLFAPKMSTTSKGVWRKRE